MKYLQRGVGLLIALLATIYAVDYLVVRIPLPKSRAALGTVIVRPYYNVGLKSGKSDLYFPDPQPQTCVNSMFSHMGYTPCWYLRKHTHPRIDM